MMSTVYTIAFRDGRFLMAFNTDRGGWEMPGGKIEDGEGVEEAAKREYLEESGYDVEVVSMRDLGHCWVCSANLKEKLYDGEMECKLFDSLPPSLSFDRDEYEDTVPWASGELAKCVH